MFRFVVYIREGKNMKDKKEDKSIKCFHKNKELIISETA